MFLFYFSIGLTILSNIFYHLSSKSISQTVNPVVSLIVTYATALVASLVILPFYPFNIGISESLRQLNWATYALGLAIIGLELGFLLAYRAGWNISFAALFANVVVALLLVPIGLLLFKERISVSNVIGIVLCIAGIVLIKQK